MSITSINGTSKVKSALFVVWAEKSAKPIPLGQRPEPYVKGCAALWANPSNKKNGTDYSSAEQYAHAEGKSVYVAYFDGRWNDAKFIDCKHDAEQWAARELQPI